jgi:hypothetical protein
MVSRLEKQREEVERLAMQARAAFRITSNYIRLPLRSTAQLLSTISPQHGPGMTAASAAPQVAAWEEVRAVFNKKSGKHGAPSHARQRHPGAA